MKKTIAIAMILAGCLSPVLAQNTPPDLHIPSITVSGEAAVLVVPDRVIINLAVETSDKNITRAKSKNNEILQDTFAALKKIGVADKNIQTENLSVEPRYDSTRNQRNFIGYFAYNSFSVTLTELDKVDPVITAALEAGVTFIRGVSFQTTELKKHRERARTLALQAAKEKAEKMTATLNQEITSPLKIIEGRSYTPYFNSGNYGSSRNAYGQNVVQNTTAAIDNVSDTLALGKISITASVSVTFGIYDNQ